MQAEFILHNALIVTPRETFHGWLAVDEGKICALGRGEPPEKAARMTDAQGGIVLPGAIDTHPHFFDPGAEWREDFAHGTAAAASGGFTTVLDMPNTQPPVWNEETFLVKKERAEKGSLIDYALWGSAMPDNIDELRHLQELGCVAYKAFTVDAGPDFAWSDEYDQLREMQAVAQMGGIFGAHAEHAGMVRRFGEACARQPWSLSLHDASRPWQAELTAINTLLLFARLTGCRLHICHMSIPEGAALIRHAKECGVDVTVETCAHYLTLNAQDNAALGTFAKINPPLRTRVRMERLWDYVLDGSIDYLGTDHAPYLTREKMPEEGPRAAACGAPEIDIAIPLLLEEGVKKRGMTLQRFAAFTAENAAKRFGLAHRKGALRVGADADFYLADLDSPWVYSRRNSLSKSCDTGFAHEGRTFSCRIKATWVRGKAVWQEGRICQAPGCGQFLHPQIL